MSHPPPEQLQLPFSPPPLPDPPALPPASILDAPTAVVVSVSGGLDSDYAALWARRRWPALPLVLWHAHLPLMDWDETLPHLRALASVLGDCRLVAVQAVYALTGARTPTGCAATTLRRCHIVQDGDRWFGPATDDDPDVLLTLLDFAQRARQGQPPTTRRRWCTSYFKTSLFDAWARQGRAALGERPILLSGERWAESPARAQLPPWEWRAAIALQPNARTGFPGWQLAWLRPGIARRLPEVAGAVLEAGIPLHPGYAAQGETPEALRDPTRDERGRARLSCRVCIYSRTAHLQHALAHHPAQVRPTIEAVRAYEAATGYHWRQRESLAPLFDHPAVAGGAEHDQERA